MRTTAVIPAFNESGRIAATLAAVAAHVDAVVVVDDGSTDDTAAVARAHAKVRVVRHRLNRGQGAALRTGTEAALRLGADVIVHVDADGQHDPADLPALIDRVREGGFDVAFGSRFLGTAPGMPSGRRALLAAARWFNALAMGIPHGVSDPQSGLRALSAAAARQIDFRQDRMAHCSEILRLVTRSQLRWTEVPAHVHYTEQSLAKGQRSVDALKIAWHLLLGVFAE